MVVRAGAGAEKYSPYTAFIAAKSFMSARYTVVRTTLSNDAPPAFRMAPMLSITRRVWAATSPSTIAPVAGSRCPWPDTKSMLPARMPWE